MSLRVLFFSDSFFCTSSDTASTTFWIDSEVFAKFIDDGEHEAGDSTFSYAKMSDSDAEAAREDLVRTKGYFILPSELFCNVKEKAANDENLNETLEKIFNKFC